MKRMRRSRLGGASVARDRASAATWMVYTRLPVSWKARMMERSRLSGWSIQEIIRRALDDYFGNPDEDELTRRVMEKWGPVYERTKSEFEGALQHGLQMFVQRYLARPPEERL